MRRGIPQVILALALCTAPLSAQAPAPADLPNLLSGYGIRPIQPSAPASNFTLPDLSGTESSLSDYYGSWVVLTFFATWCGPCRSELPTLERLHRERVADGVVVLGVSIDDPGAPLEDFVRQLGLTFPILWDKTQQVGAAYRASSIPISYLVSPEGQLAGVSRGSRDWAALSPMFDGALAAVPATQTLDAAPAPDAYADAGESVATPSVSDPPTAEVRLANETVRAGEPFYLDIDLHWAGNFEEYLPHPPEVLLPEGVTRQSVTAESFSRDGSNQVRYQVTLLAEKPGKYALDPVEVRYTPRFEATPVAGRILGPTVEVVAPTILGLSPGAFAGGAAGLAFLGLAGFFAGRRFLGRETGRSESAATALYEELRSGFEEARKKRLQGDGAGYLLALADLDQKLRSAQDARGDGEVSEASSLTEAVERARYGGQVPPADQLDRLQRSLERGLEELRPDTRRDEREELQLRDSD